MKVIANRAGCEKALECCRILLKRYDPESVLIHLVWPVRRQTPGNSFDRLSLLHQPSCVSPCVRPRVPPAACRFPYRWSQCSGALQDAQTNPSAPKTAVASVATMRHRSPRCLQGLRWSQISGLPRPAWRLVFATRRTSAWRAAAMSRCAPSRNTVLNKSYPSGWRSGTTIPFLGVAYPLRMLKSISTIESKQVIPPSSIHRRTPESLIPRFPRPGKLVSTIRAVRHAGSIDLRCSAMPSTQ